MFKAPNGLALPAIDEFLTNNREEDNRAHHVNSPSQAGNCNRQNYYARIGTPSDDVVDPRGERIFDNGDDVHNRIQGYLERHGLLLMREVPLRNDEYNVQGHTDGLLEDKPKEEIVPLEIKSINDNGFNVVKQKGPKEEHIKQASVYSFTLEEHRKYLRLTYKSITDLKNSRKVRKWKYAKLYRHLKDGKKYTRQQKILKKVKEHLQADEILWNCKNPIHRISFIYENKNNQEIREFIVEVNKAVLKEVLINYANLEKAIEKETPPPREGKNKSDPICRWCQFKVECWN